MKKLTPSGDDLQVLPAQGAGSACGQSLGALPMTKLGYGKKFNNPLELARDGAEVALVDFTLDGQPEPPPYFGNLKRVNRAGSEVTCPAPTPPGLKIQDVATRPDEPGFVILDTRPDLSASASSHLRGSLHASAKGDLSGLAGPNLQPSDQMVLVVESAGEVDMFARRLFRVGFDHIIG